MINRYPNMILKEKWNLGYIDLVKHEIYFKYNYSIKQPVRYLNPRLADWLKKKLTWMKSIRMIRKSYSFYALLITIIEVEKPDEMFKIYLYSNVFDLNNITIKDIKYSCS